MPPPQNPRLESHEYFPDPDHAGPVAFGFFEPHQPPTAEICKWFEAKHNASMAQTLEFSEPIAEMVAEVFSTNLGVLDGRGLFLFAEHVGHVDNGPNQPLSIIMIKPGAQFTEDDQVIWLYTTKSLAGLLDHLGATGIVFDMGYAYAEHEFTPGAQLNPYHNNEVDIHDRFISVLIDEFPRTVLLSETLHGGETATAASSAKKAMKQNKPLATIQQTRSGRVITPSQKARLASDPNEADVTATPSSNSASTTTRGATSNSSMTQVSSATHAALAAASTTPSAASSSSALPNRHPAVPTTHPPDFAHRLEPFREGKLNKRALLSDPAYARLSDCEQVLALKNNYTRVSSYEADLGLFFDVYAADRAGGRLKSRREWVQWAVDGKGFGRTVRDTKVVQWVGCLAAIGWIELGPE